MKKWKKLLIIFVSAALLVGAVLVLKPRYDAFIERDNIETCYDAMYWTGIWYHMAIRDEKRAGKNDNEIDYPGILKTVLSEHYAASFDNNLESDDFCRGGGHVQMVIDPDTHGLMIMCSHPLHIWYNDEAVDDELLDYLEKTSQPAYLQLEEY